MGNVENTVGDTFVFWVNRDKDIEVTKKGGNTSVFSQAEVRESVCSRINSCLNGIGIASCGGCTTNKICVAKFLSK